MGDNFIINEDLIVKKYPWIFTTTTYHHFLADFYFSSEQLDKNKHEWWFIPKSDNQAMAWART